VLVGVRAAQAQGARCKRATAVLDELDAAKSGLRRAHRGDLLVICADDAAQVYSAAMEHDRGSGIAIGDPGEFAAPEG
jgi:cyanophycin synthetase